MLEVEGPAWIEGRLDAAGRDFPKLEFDEFMIVGMRGRYVDLFRGLIQSVDGLNGVSMVDGADVVGR